MNAQKIARRRRKESYRIMRTDCHHTREVELPGGDVYSDNGTHAGTSWVRKDGSLHPISYVKEVRDLNQPIGIAREL